MSQQLYVKNEDGTFVPAAGVQGDVMRALNDARNTAMKNAVVARIPECADFAAIAQNLDWAMDNITNTVQPDSGRDAALRLAQDALKISVPVMRHYPAPVVRHAEALAAVNAALAAHPAPSSDAHPRDTCKCAHIGECDGSCAPYIAAHPANGAQAGDASDDEGLIWSLRDDAAKLKESNPDDEMAETMIEAADRIEGFAAAPQKKEG